MGEKSGTDVSLILTFHPPAVENRRRKVWNGCFYIRERKCLILKWQQVCPGCRWTGALPSVFAFVSQCVQKGWQTSACVNVYFNHDISLCVFLMLAPEVAKTVWERVMWQTSLVQNQKLRTGVTSWLGSCSAVVLMSAVLQESTSGSSSHHWFQSILDSLRFGIILLEMSAVRVLI